MNYPTPARPASPLSPVPGTAQALWQQVLEQLRAAGHGRAAALWTTTTPVARSPEAFTIAAPTSFACSQLAGREQQRQFSVALEQAAGRPLRLVCVLGTASDEEDDPLIRAVLARINALNRPRPPAEG